MHLNLPKKSTFWVAVVIAAVSLIVYIVHMFFLNNIPYFGGVGYLLLLVAFVLLYLGLTIKGL
jgi:hypothetical protein